MHCWHRGFLVQQLELTGIDLTPRLPSGVVDQSHNLYLLTRVLPAPNSELRLEFHPEKLEVAGHLGSMGIWMPATLKAVVPEGSSAASNHYCDGITAEGTLPGVCGEILQRMNEGIREAAGTTALDFSCHRVDMSLEVRRFHLWFGIVPETAPNCDPLAHRWDLEWMKNIPSPREYRQGCLRSRGDLLVVVDAEPKSSLFPNTTADLLFTAEVSKCSTLVKAACETVIDCPAKTREIAEQQLEQILPQRMRDSLNEQLGPMFNYQAPPDSPYLSATPPPPCNPMSNAKCAQAVRAHHLPASLTRLTYGWFGNAFGSFETTPTYQFPVTSIDGSCPLFHTYVRGTPYDRCINCPGEVCKPDFETGTCVGLGGMICLTNQTAPTGFDIWYAVDPDGDGVKEPKDNCPMLANPAQADSDGDGIGDLCDFCPCSGDNDPDRDGVCTLACKGPGDNCPTIANPFQENCNLDAEVARGGELLGDVCDPVPCPRFEPVYSTSKSGEAKSPLYVDVQVKQALDRIDVSPLGSHTKTASATTEVQVIVPETHYRYCIDSPPPPQGAGALCFVDSAVADTWLSKATSASTETTETLWHRVSINGLPAGTPDGQWSYVTGNDFTRYWDYTNDFKLWQTSAWGASWVPNLAGAIGSADPFFNFKGRFWVHAATAVGTTDLSLNTGMHGLAYNPAQPADGQSNHYEPLTPYSKYVFYQAIGIKELFVDRECHWCGSAITTAHDEECSFCGVEALRELPSAVSRVIVRNGDDRIGVVSASGALSPLRAELGPSLATSLDSSLLWVDQAEPSAYLGKGLVSPVAVGISPSDGALVDEVFAADGRLLARADLLRARDGDLGLSSASVGPTESPNRAGFVPVYSRSLARVFLVGGSNASGHDIAFRALESDGMWQQVPSGEVSLGTPLAATYNNFDGHLWILDQVSGPKGDLARILRIHPDSGHAEVLAEWPRAGRYDQHFLRVDRDGALLVVASSAKHHSHALIRLELTAGRLEPTGFRTRPRALAHPPVVDAAGYWLITAKEKGQLDVERLERLPLVPASDHAQVGQCW